MGKNAKLSAEFRRRQLFALEQCEEVGITDLDRAFCWGAAMAYAEAAAEAGR